MTFIHDIDNKIRFLVLYQDVSKKASVIQKYTGLNIRTIYNWIEKTEQNINILEKAQGQGRRSSIASNIKSNLVRTTRRNPSKTTVRSLSNKYEVGKTTAHHILTEKSFQYCKVQKAKTLTQDEEKKRIVYCRDMINKNGKRIHSSFFADEMGMSLADAHREKVWNPPRKKVKVEEVRKDIKLNCWAAISYNGATKLHIYENNLTAKTYESILDKHKKEMDDLYPEGYYFLHDNSQVHVSTENWMKGQNFNLIKFPTYSPDLSPIENLWSAVKVAVAKDNPKTNASLKASLLRNWEILTKPEHLRLYFDTLNGRYVECIEKKGIRLPY